MLVRSIFALVCALSISSNAYSAKPQTEKEWRLCAEKAAASVDEYSGMVGVTLAIEEKCGSRPVVKQKSGGYALLKTDCDWLYNQPLKACLQYTEYKCEYLPSGAHRIDSGFSEQAFDPDKFAYLCKRVCELQKIPDRHNFGMKICGETGGANAGNSEWRDTATGIVWSRCSLGQKWTGSTCSGDAIKYTWRNAIAAAKKSKGWRLPNIDELRTLLSSDAVSRLNGVLYNIGYSSPNNTLIKPVPDDFGTYWSSSSVASNLAWSVHFNNGYDDKYSNKEFLGYVRLVRASE